MKLAAGDGGDDAHFVAVLQRGGLVVEKANVLLVHVNIHEAAHLAVVIEQALDDVESRGGEPPSTLDDIRSVDARTREFSRTLVSELQSRR